MLQKMTLYLRRIHNKFVKLINVVFNVIFIILYELYNTYKKRKLARQRSKHALDDPMHQHLIDMEKVIDTDRENVIHEFKIDGKEMLPMTRTNALINDKNKWKWYFTTTIYSLVYLYLSYLLLYCIYGLMVGNTETARIDTVIDENDTVLKNGETIHWYYANLGLKKYKTFSELKHEYYGTIMQPCRPLTIEEIETNVLSNPKDNYEIDLTLIYHILCHVATDQVISNGNMNVVIPKYLNISQIRKVENESPIDLMNDGIALSLDNLELPNICVMAIAAPDDKIHRHENHEHWKFEKKIGKNIPSGSFIHTSVSHHENSTITQFTLNPITRTSIHQMWKQIPVQGECAILVNPDIAQKNTDDEKYTITHTSHMLEEEKLFDSHLIKDIEIKYTALDQTHKHWIPPGRKESIFVQVANNILYSKNCLDESHE